MKINIQNPQALVQFAETSLKSWKIEYIGRGEGSDIYYYSVTHKANRRIKIAVEIGSETQQLYDTESFQRMDDEYVKIYCKDVNVPQKRGCTKFIRVEEFKDIRRVFNQIHNGARYLIQ